MEKGRCGQLVLAAREILVNNVAGGGAGGEGKAEVSADEIIQEGRESTVVVSWDG